MLYRLVTHFHGHCSYLSERKKELSEVSKPMNNDIVLEDWNNLLYYEG